MTTRLVLHDTTEIVWIGIRRHRTARNRRAITPHITYTTVVGRILDKHHKCLTELILGYTVGLHRILITSCVVWRNALKRVLRTKLSITNGVHGTHTRVVRHTEDGIDIEVVAICLVWLNIEVVAYCLGDTCEIVAPCNIARIEAVTHKYDIHATTHSSSLINKHIAIAIFVVILLNLKRCTIVLVIEQEYHLTRTTIVLLILMAIVCTEVYLKCTNLRIGHLINSNSDLNFTNARRWCYSHPLWAALHAPRLTRWCTQHQLTTMLCIEGTHQTARDSKVVVCSNALKLTPARSTLVAIYRRLRHLHRKVILRHAIKRSRLHNRRLCRAAHYLTKSIAVYKCS